MIILNKIGSGFHYLSDHGPQYCNSILPNFLNLDESLKFWYIEFKSSLTHLGKIIPPPILNLLKQQKITLILANSHEAFHSVVKEIYDKAIGQLDIPEESLILISESADCLDEIKKISKLYNKKEIKAIWVRQFEANFIMQSKTQPPTTKTLENKFYDKKFLNFNRRWRLHRPLFVALLKSKNILEKGYVSLAKSDDRHSWQSIWPLLEHYHNTPYNSSQPELYNILMQNKEAVCSLPDMYLDTEDLTINQAELTSRTDKFYNDTYFSVVSETNFYTSIQPFEGGRFFSEKTFKPIFNKHPFVLISPPKSLELLRSLGYATFHPYINESYDNESDDFKRILMIAEEVERLCNLNDTELQEFLENTEIICKHNYTVLNSKNPKTDCSINLNF